MPIDNTSAERSFSTLRLIWNHLSTTMNEQRVSDLSLLAIEKDLAKSVDPDNLVIPDNQLWHFKA